MTGMEALGYSISTIFLTAGVLLILAEAVIPGAHFIILGVAMFLTGVIGTVTLVGGNLLYLTVTFGVVSICVYLGYSRFDLYSGDGGPIGTTDSDSLVGIHGIVTDPVTTTSGEVNLEKTGFTSNYKARVCSDEDAPIPVGAEVVVTDGQGGNVVEVERVPESN